MKGNFYLSHTEPLRTFTEKEMLLEKATTNSKALGTFVNCSPSAPGRRKEVPFF